jgi:hypothetical protein
MMCLPTRLVERGLALAAIAALAASAAGCSSAQAGDVPNVGVSQQGLDGPLASLAAACGLGCPGDEDDKGVEIKGVADGNAAISGVASIDAFFASVIRFKGVARGVENGLKGQLDLIRSDFGIAADADLGAQLDAQFKANLEGSAEFKVDPPRCDVDISASLKAKARCEGEVNPGMVEVECKGGCEVDATVEAKCDAGAKLECTFVPPDLSCSGSCSGSCQAPMVNAACSGTCRGECSGTCSAYVKNASGEAECAGSCSGMCMGSCEVEVTGGECEGSCKGECTVTDPEGGCKAAIRAECKAEANASVMCEGKCTGDIEPPSAKVECEASAKAEAKMNVQCTPPRVTFAYKLKAATGAEVQVRAKFEAALKLLVNSRIPALKAELARAGKVREAGLGLASSAGSALEAGFNEAVDGDSSLRVKVGVLCAVDELDEVGAVIESSANSLKTQIDVTTAVMGKIKA